jgi:hypothetical protein
MTTAVVLTVGNEIVCGDVENTNSSWLARRLAELGMEVTLLAAVRDDVGEIAAFLAAEKERAGTLTMHDFFMVQMEHRMAFVRAMATGSGSTPADNRKRLQNFRNNAENFRQ